MMCDKSKATVLLLIAQSDFSVIVFYRIAVTQTAIAIPIRSPPLYQLTHEDG